MPIINLLRAVSPRLADVLAARVVLLRKAFSFAIIGLVNTLVDATLFFVGYTYLTDTPGMQRFIGGAADACGCVSPDNLRLILINVASWIIAVTGSYVMNSFITFAAESGGKLRWRAYGTFVASSVVGGVANTVTLVALAQILPVWFAKLAAIGVSFLVNFSMSHFVVFRPRADATEKER